MQWPRGTTRSTLAASPRRTGSAHCSMCSTWRPRPIAEPTVPRAARPGLTAKTCSRRAWLAVRAQPRRAGHRRDHHWLTSRPYGADASCSASWPASCRPGRGVRMPARRGAGSPSRAVAGAACARWRIASDRGTGSCRPAVKIVHRAGRRGGLSCRAAIGFRPEARRRTMPCRCSCGTRRWQGRTVGGRDADIANCFSAIPARSGSDARAAARNGSVTSGVLKLVRAMLSRRGAGRTGRCGRDRWTGRSARRSGYRRCSGNMLPAPAGPGVGRSGAHASGCWCVTAMTW